MTNATALLATLLCVTMCAAADNRPKPVFACNLRAISPGERPRYNELVKRVRTSLRKRREIANGYVFWVDPNVVALPELAEWINLERLCCPFLTLQLSVAGNESDWILTLMGPEGVKPLIVAEFPVGA